MSENEADSTYDLPYTYLPHPRYYKKGTIPAYEMIKFSVNIHRGCFGGCSFCAIAAHQGKQIIRRSEKSINAEIEKIAKMPDFKGYLSDLGGPSANMFGMKGKEYDLCLKCSRPSCIWPQVCKNLDTDHRNLTSLYRKVNRMPGIKKAFIGSGIRYDLLFPEWNKNAGAAENEYLEELIVNHVSGRLKVAPEHTSPQVLNLMRKVPFSLFRKLKQKFEKITEKEGLKYQIVPYFISSHPGSTKENMEFAGIRSEGAGNLAGAGSGFHSDTDDSFDHDVLYRVSILIPAKGFTWRGTLKKNGSKRSSFSGTRKAGTLSPGLKTVKPINKKLFVFLKNILYIIGCNTTISLIAHKNNRCKSACSDTPQAGK